MDDLATPVVPLQITAVEADKREFLEVFKLVKLPFMVHMTDQAVTQANPDQTVGFIRATQAAVAWLERDEIKAHLDQLKAKATQQALQPKTLSRDRPQVSALIPTAR